jgi:hypothetical protein
LLNGMGRTVHDGNREDVPYLGRAVELLALKDSALMTSVPDIPMVQIRTLECKNYIALALCSATVCFQFAILHIIRSIGLGSPSA